MDDGQMIWIAFTIAAICLPFVVARWLKRDIRRIEFADEAWGSVEKHATQLLGDKSLNPDIGDLVEMILKRAGNGWMTRSFLFFLVVRPKPHKSAAGGFDAAFKAMTDGQRHHFLRFTIDALLFDSLRAGLIGVILRRILYWLANTAQNEKEPIALSQVEPIARMADRKLQLA